jgi:hypothetical protein
MRSQSTAALGSYDSIANTGFTCAEIGEALLGFRSAVLKPVVDGWWTAQKALF